MTFPLAPDDLRGFVATDLGDPQLQILLDYAEGLINRRIGPPGDRTEIIRGGGLFVSPSRPIDTVTSVTETYWGSSLSLDATDYRLRSGGYLLERLRTGTNPRFRWWGDVTVIYAPLDDDSIRTGVQLALCNLQINSHPGLTAETIGAWSQQFAANSAWNTTAEEESILSRLDPEVGMVIVDDQRWPVSWGSW
jgi:hypothetical protein